MTTAAKIPMKWAENPVNDNKIRCSCCGREITGQAMAVEVIDGGDSVAALGLNPDPNDPGYMGVQYVGYGCAKKHFPGFAFPADVVKGIK